MSFDIQNEIDQIINDDDNDESKNSETEHDKKTLTNSRKRKRNWLWNRKRKWMKLDLTVVRKFICCLQSKPQQLR